MGESKPNQQLSDVAAEMKSTSQIEIVEVEGREYQAFRVEASEEYERLRREGAESQLWKTRACRIEVATALRSVGTGVDATSRIAYPGDVVITNLDENGNATDTYVFGNASGGPAGVDARRKAFLAAYIPKDGQKEGQDENTIQDGLWVKKRPAVGVMATRNIVFSNGGQQFVLLAGGYLTQALYPIAKESLNEYRVVEIEKE